MKVYLLSRPKLIEESFDDFYIDEGITCEDIPAMSSAEALVEFAGRLCYMSFGRKRSKTNAQFNAHLIHQGHLSVLEHANWTLLITGVSRSLTHEFVRHRHFSYSQLSQRYVDHANMSFVVPPGMPDGLAIEWETLMHRVRNFYTKLNEPLVEGQPDTTEKKRVRTIARSVLPNAMTTKIVVTGNARAWREFITKRAVPLADPEIHALAVEIYRKLSAAAPSLFTGLLGGNECEST